MSLRGRRRSSKSVRSKSRNIQVLSHEAKVFSIGFHKTGTTTLRVCLEQLGYRICPVQTLVKYNQETDKGNYYSVLRECLHWDAFIDGSWNVEKAYEKIFAAYPKAKFIFTTRNFESYFRSAKTWWKRRHIDSRAWKIQIGCLPIEENKEQIRKVYSKRVLDVQAYFKTHPTNLLVVDWEKGDGWEKLCEFLGKQVPNTSFPWENKTQYD